MAWLTTHRAAGNFSFARSLVDHHLAGQGGSLVATSYDDAAVARSKYENEVDANMEAIEAASGTVLFGVDGTDLARCKALRHRKFTRIVFNFPHAGAGIKDQDRNIRVNQELLLAFFASAKQFLADTDGSEVHVSLKSGEPYNSWQVRKLARAHGLACVRSMAFRPECYPGYAHRRTLGFKEGVSASGNEEIMDKNPRMLIFARKEDSDHTNIKKSATKGAKTRRSEAQHPNHSDDDDDEE
ncbi:hypothetical protein SYNPS1DRAFT_27986 [Syncephalis pseudoplumigaleata]|uniref:25S rRNA (uridine-N(3))-methyltransferase BMT5-like domain-containing protein n=1 Tax=Syncephalis pseudoplumigaleata TaxID=1712513 RepID=A0A4P9Z1E3_9FUNG|nr:hypothetical protein SYNPS1DRAFT_27986 [Syncephalis pseudoplumigaleata]|eukprot:RKP26313.1 hypothetical protein SYNPS1DRAFT_27986 [Syncephalis pseudoplumigaleata]